MPMTDELTIAVEAVAVALTAFAALWARGANRATNGVKRGEPKLKDRVENIEAGQKQVLSRQDDFMSAIVRLEDGHKDMREKLGEIRGLVKGLTTKGQL